MAPDNRNWCARSFEGFALLADFFSQRRTSAPVIASTGTVNLGEVQVAVPLKSETKLMVTVVFAAIEPGGLPVAARRQLQRCRAAPPERRQWGPAPSVTPLSNPLPPPG